MEALQVKDVEFNGAVLKAVQDVNKTIWVGVRWVCEGIGFREDKTDNERKKLSKDIVLSRGVKFYSLPTNRGNQDVLCLQLDYLPLWLAKISITPTMQRNNPEVVERLVEYQIKAKDVLAAAFLPSTTQHQYPESEQRFIQIPLPDYSGLLARIDVLEACLLMKSSEQFAKSNGRMESLEQRMDDFTMNMTNLSRFIVDKLEKFEMWQKPEDLNMAIAAEPVSYYNEDRSAWKKKVYKLMDDIVIRDSRFSDRADIYKYLYKLMRKEDGAVWEQYIKEYKERYDMDSRPATIDVCYDDVTLRSIFMAKLENTAYNCGAIDNSYLVDSPMCLIEDVMPEDLRRKNTPLKTSIVPLSEMIRPLVDIYNDTSMNGAITYKQVYQHMTAAYNVSWKNNETRYITKNSRRPKTKAEIILDNPRLYEKFKKAVEDLLEQTEQRGVEVSGKSE